MEGEDIKVIKTRQFGKRIISLYKFLSNKKIDVISRQILRSGTSISANVSESVFSESRIDFRHKIAIALKETNETLYWLDLLNHGDYITNEQYNSLRDDCSEIIKILQAIIKSSKSND